MDYSTLNEQCNLVAYPMPDMDAIRRDLTSWPWGTLRSHPADTRDERVDRAREVRGRDVLEFEFGIVLVQRRVVATPTASASQNTPFPYYAVKLPSLHTARQLTIQVHSNALCSSPMHTPIVGARLRLTGGSTGALRVLGRGL